MSQLETKSDWFLNSTTQYMLFSGLSKYHMEKLCDGNVWDCPQYTWRLTFSYLFCGYSNWLSLKEKDEKTLKLSSNLISIQIFFFQSNHSWIGMKSLLFPVIQSYGPKQAFLRQGNFFKYCTIEVAGKSWPGFRFKCSLRGPSITWSQGILTVIWH